MSFRLWTWPLLVLCRWKFPEIRMFCGRYRLWSWPMLDQWHWIAPALTSVADFCRGVLERRTRFPPLNEPNLLFFGDDRFLPQEFLHSPGVQKRRVGLTKSTRFWRIFAVNGSPLSPCMEMSFASREWWKPAFSFRNLDVQPQSIAWRNEPKRAWEAEFSFSKGHDYIVHIFVFVILFLSVFKNFTMTIKPRPSACRKVPSFFLSNSPFLSGRITTDLLVLVWVEIILSLEKRVEWHVVHTNDPFYSK